MRPACLLGCPRKTVIHQQFCESLKSHRNAYVATCYFTSYSDKIHGKESLQHKNGSGHWPPPWAYGNALKWGGGKKTTLP